MTAERRGRLSLVPTPIGHLDDITLRALTTLREADLLLAEDTRVSRKLCARHGIDTPLRAHHAHSSDAAVQAALDELLAGKHVALLSDAGTPLINDPGARLVRAAVAAGIAVEALPGASAVTTALAVSGVPFDSFRFLGFAPRTGGKRTRWLAALAADPGASVFFEAPRRLPKTLAALAARLPQSRQMAVCRELTKLHEEVARGSAAELAQRFADPPRGEITVVVGAGEPAEASPAADRPDAAAEARSLLAQGMSARDAARALAARLDLPRRQAYHHVREAAEANEAKKGAPE